MAVYAVTYNSNSGTSGNVPVDSTEYADLATVRVIVNEGHLGRDGYALIGWNTAADGSGITYHPGDEFAIATADVILYAVWVAHEYAVSKLITNAFYLSKVRSADFQTVGGSDTARGLDCFNKILASMSSNTRQIPYYKEYIIDAVVGQEKYFIPELVEALSLTFNMNTVRFATTTLSRRQYHSSTRIDGVLALPFSNTFERTRGGCNLYVQYLPIETYEFRIWGKFGLEGVTVADLTTNLLLSYDLWYIDYLEHLTAKRICQFYGVPIDPEIQHTIDNISHSVGDMNPIDLTSSTVNFYSDHGGGTNWPMLNLSRGFYPGGW